MNYSPPSADGVITLPVISAVDGLGSAFGFAGLGSVAYPLANLALHVPFTVSQPVTAYEGWVITGATAGGNFDIGIYSSSGSRLTSAGSTARTASAVNNTTTMTDQVLLPDVRYYMAFSADGANNYISAAPAAGLCEAMGILESTTSFVLPLNPTLSRTTRAYIPFFGLNLYTVAL